MPKLFYQETDEEIIVDIEKECRRLKKNGIYLIIGGVIFSIAIFGIVFLILGIILITQDNVKRFKTLQKYYEKKGSKKRKRVVYTNMPPEVEEYYKQISQQ